MLTSSTEFVKSFLWKYVDITINKSEIELLKSKVISNTVLLNMFHRFKNIFYDKSDIENIIFIISIIEPCYWNNFIIFYMTYVRKFEVENDEEIKTIITIEDLDNFINTDEKKFKLLLICLYYYF